METKKYESDFYYYHERIKTPYIRIKKRFTHHSASFGGSTSRPKNEAYDFKLSIFEININNTMIYFKYEYNFYYDDVLIENIVPVESKLIDLPLYYLIFF